MNDIIIIGCGPIGLYGASISALHSLKGLVIESLDVPGGQLTSLYPEKDIVDLPGFECIKAKDFIANLMKQHDRNENKLPIHFNEKVIDIIKQDDESYLIKTDKDEYLTRTVVITTGMGSFSPRPIGLPNENEFKNIAYSCSDSSIYKDKDVVILGGGDSAVDLSLLIKPVSKSTTIIHRRKDFRAQDSTVQEMSKIGVNVLINKGVVSLDGDERMNLHIIDNETKEEEVISCDNILVQYGQIPSKDNFEVEKVNNLIVVKEFYETSLPNVFACGNIIDYKGKVKNITSGLGEITTIITKIDQIINPNKNIPIHF